MNKHQSQITIYFPNKQERDNAGAMLDRVARDLGLKSRRSIFDILLANETDLAVVVQELAVRQRSRHQ